MGGSALPLKQSAESSSKEKEQVIEKYSVEDFLRIMLHPLYRYVVVGQDAGMMSARPLLAKNVKLAQQVIELLKNRVGVSKFVSVYSEIQGTVEKKRLQKKSALAVKAITNPQAHTKIRTARNIRKRNSRYRKIQKRKFGLGGQIFAKPVRKRKADGISDLAQAARPIKVQKTD